MTYLYEILNIGHSDVKPDNFLIMDDEYSLTISDYGVARQLMQDAHKNSNAQSIRGTPLFFSPELMYKYMNGDEEQSINVQKSDVFSVGLTILNLCVTNIKGLNRNESKLKKDMEEFQEVYG